MTTKGKKQIIKIAKLKQHSKTLDGLKALKLRAAEIIEVAESLEEKIDIFQKHL